MKNFKNHSKKEMHQHTFFRTSCYTSLHYSYGELQDYLYIVSNV
jgi:hypothetical protein